MEIPLRTAYGQAGRCGMQPKATQSSRAGASKTTRGILTTGVNESDSLLTVHDKTTGGLLVKKVVILNQVTRATLELAPLLRNSTPQQRQDFEP
ncbi:hypothetical protein TNCV_2038511 [Trichonephila clavipes]|nr:hypothetical protein TNCV_2038511 [Trichonephila clavipes]